MEAVCAATSATTTANGRFTCKLGEGVSMRVCA